MTFGEITALADISIDFPAGGIHAVVGQNGAGKTTLARTIAGIVRPDTGSLHIHGQDIETGNVQSARRAGIELVHQSFALPPSFTVAEALEFGRGGGIGFFSRKELARRAGELLDTLEMDIDPDSRIRDLPIELQQAVEIARALSSNARILILDEPTAVLPPPEIESLFQRIRKLGDSGVTVLLILHKTREIEAVADSITVLRNGRFVAGPLPCEEIEADRVAEMIMGTETEKPDPGSGQSDGMTRPAHDGDPGQVKPMPSGPASAYGSALELSGVRTDDTAAGICLDDVTLSVKCGEIVGIAGVEGNGQATLMRVLAGLAGVSEGRMDVCGTPAGELTLAQRRSLGLRIIPFDRNSEGLSLTSMLWENWVAGELVGKPLFSLINPPDIRQRCTASMSIWGVNYSSVGQHAGSLSGGNCQKLILARELDDAARTVIAAQPTRGLDIGATSFVWSTLRTARHNGCGILLISSDLDELFEISDRILVMRSGRIVCQFGPPFDVVQTGRAMMGAAA
ncbi:MAG: ATP-binding cassette domain-containing protein [Rhodobacteraceae bacterium]|nr:ATP-binding cassette domain-containing protein [Paracoccaceae bacterium]